MRYGNATYQAVDGVQRLGDGVRSMCRGRYAIENGPGGALTVHRRGYFLGKDLPLEEMDFSGVVFEGKNNRRLERALERHFKLEGSNHNPREIDFNPSSDVRTAADTFYERIRQEEYPHTRRADRIDDARWATFGAVAAPASAALITYAAMHDAETFQPAAAGIIGAGLAAFSIGTIARYFGDLIESANFARNREIRRRIIGSKLPDFPEIGFYSHTPALQELPETHPRAAHPRAHRKVM